MPRTREEVSDKYLTNVAEIGIKEEEARRIGEILFKAYDRNGLTERSAIKILKESLETREYKEGLKEKKMIAKEILKKKIDEFFNSSNSSGKFKKSE